MTVRILGKSPELTLIFDRSSVRLSNEQLDLLGQTLSEVEGVKSVQTRTVWYRSPRITVIFGSETEPNAILRKMASALRTPGDPTSSNHQSAHRSAASEETDCSDSLNGPNSASDESVPQCSEENKAIASGGRSAFQRRLREWSYGILTLGSFGMAWVGLVVPGIPTVPFVLLTAHFALQASPALRQWLLKSRMFGPTMRDWQEHRAIHRSVQIQAYAFTVIIMIIGFVLSPPIPTLYALIAVMGVFGLCLISQIPVIESTKNNGSVKRVNGFGKIGPVVA